jgi:hypothetical protein
MSDQQQAPTWKVILGSIVLIAFFVLPIWEQWLLALILSGPLIGVLFIWALIRTLIAAMIHVT